MWTGRRTGLALAALGATSCSLDFEGFFEASSSATADAASSSAAAGAGAAAGTGAGAVASSSSTGGAGAGGTGGAGGMALMPEVAGCSDGTREGFIDTKAFPNIAACSGGFSVPGLRSQESLDPQCNYVSGNTSPNPTGNGCSVADLCDASWHVCEGREEVAERVPGCTNPPIMNGRECCPDDVSATRYFYLTRQRFDNSNCITTVGVNNLLGCGKLIGELPQMTDSCEPLDTKVRNTQCDPDPDWYCGKTPVGDDNESEIVTKDKPTGGGVLCCRTL